MSNHKDAGTRCLVFHGYDQGQCIGCTCGKWHTLSEFLELTTPEPQKEDDE